MKVKEESKKVGLKFNIPKTKIMVSGPTTTSWQIEGETMETLTDFIFWGSKITVSVMNFQMFKLVSEKIEEPEIKLPTSAGS